MCHKNTLYGYLAEYNDVCTLVARVSILASVWWLADKNDARPVKNTQKFTIPEQLLQKIDMVKLKLNIVVYLLLFRK